MWRHSLLLRPVTLILGVSIVSVAFITGNIFLLRSIRNDAAVIGDVSKGRTLDLEYLTLAHQLVAGTGPSRETVLAGLRDVIERNDRRFVRLTEGVGGLPRVPGPVRIGLEERENRWRAEIRPLVERVASSVSVEDGRALVAQLVRLESEQKESRDTDVELAQRLSEQKVDDFRRLQYVFMAVVALAFVPALLVGRDVARRARVLAATAERIAAGELELSAPVTGRDELSLLGTSFNSMTTRLRSLIDQEEHGRTELERTLRAVADTAHRLASASAEILVGTSQQASGAQQQAAAVAETVATVEEVTSAADQTAARAREVAATAKRSADIADSGRTAVEQSVAGMEAVNECVEEIAASILALADQAQAISEIIATVNDIAEQTNLLALNASIEATRASEQGKGFQVVASEIKELAGQAKRATTQITRILGDIQTATQHSVVATEEGTRRSKDAIKVVGEAGDTISMLAETIAQAALAATQIAGSAAQQAAGMAQINDAMRSVDQATSQSLSATRQSEAAAHDLDALGSTLTELLAGFGR